MYNMHRLWNFRNQFTCVYKYNIVVKMFSTVKILFHDIFKSISIHLKARMGLVPLLVELIIEIVCLTFKSAVQWVIHSYSKISKIQNHEFLKSPNPIHNLQNNILGLKYLFWINNVFFITMIKMFFEVGKTIFFWLILCFAVPTYMLFLSTNA